MRPWQLHDKAARDAVFARLEMEAAAWWCGCVVTARDITKACTTCVSAREAHRAAIALLESACEFDDDALVVRVGDRYVGHVEDWDNGPMGIFVRVHADGGLMSLDWRPEQLTPLTPAADSLLRALRGDE